MLGSDAYRPDPSERLPGKPDRRPQRDVDEAPLAERDAWTGLWDSAWQLCEGVGKSAAVVSDGEERVATALAKALGAVYESGASVGTKACRTLRKGSQVIKVLALMQGILARLNGSVAERFEASGGVVEIRSKPAMSRKFKRVTPFEQSYLDLMKSILPLKDDAWVQVMLQLSQHVADALLERTCVARVPWRSAQSCHALAHSRAVLTRRSPPLCASRH